MCNWCDKYGESNDPRYKGYCGSSCWARATETKMEEAVQNLARLEREYKTAKHRYKEAKKLAAGLDEFRDKHAYDLR